MFFVRFVLGLVLDVVGIGVVVFWLKGFCVVFVDFLIYWLKIDLDMGGWIWLVYLC